jgi:CRP/FNR family transcriptional regulator, cyclic AMP receptor protein
MEWPIFRGVPEAEVQRVLSIARRRTFRPGEVVFHMGDPGDTLHLVVSGRFAVRVPTRLGDTVILAVRGPGEMFGELALLGTAALRSATVEALDAGETRSIHRPEFAALRRQHPSVADVLVNVLSDALARTTEHLVEALHTPADERVLRRLIDLVALYPDGEGEDGVTIPLRQEDLAGLAGTTRATANRVLRQAAERGLVRLSRGRVTILDREGLARRAKV